MRRMSIPPQSVASRHRFRIRRHRKRNRATPSQRLPRWVFRLARRLLSVAHPDAPLPPHDQKRTCDIARLQRFHFYASRSTLPALSQACVVSRNILTAVNVGLVPYTIATVINTQGESFDDMFQTGVIALMRAVDKFDPRKGMAFSSYACIVIKNDLIAMMRAPRVRLGGANWQTLYCTSIDERLLGAYDGGIASVEDRQWLDEVFDGMSEFDRRVAVLRYIHGLSGRLVAMTLEVKPSVVFSAERRIKNHLTNRLRH